MSIVEAASIEHLRTQFVRYCRREQWTAEQKSRVYEANRQPEQQAAQDAVAKAFKATAEYWEGATIEADEA
jgi:hypothetical protein